MYCTNSGRKFNDYKIYINDIRYTAIKEEDPDTFEDTLNYLIEQLNVDGYVVVGISYKVNDVYFSAVIEYIAEDNIYYNQDNEEVDTDGDAEQVQDGD